MAIPKSIGAVELSSIAVGYQVQDAMLKAANVEILIARTICSGKYFIIVGGSVSDVASGIRAALAAPSESTTWRYPTSTSPSFPPWASR
jgi:microcompartment protein CcmL/EutN